MKTKLLSVAAAVIAAAAAISGAQAAGISRPISVTEDFNTALVDGTPYTPRGSGYEWNVIATDFFGTKGGGGSVSLDTHAISLSANAGRDILTITQGAGGFDRDVEVTFGAGVSYGFQQTAEKWYMTFTSTDDKELFKLRFQNGGNTAQVTSLIVGDTLLDTDYTFTNAAFTTVTAHISFNAGSGGTVTYGNVTLPFGEGSDIAKISVSRDGVADQSRPFVIDNFSMQTLDKELVNITVQPDREDETAEGAVLTVNGETVTLDADGRYSAYMLVGSYPYTVKMPEHKPKSGTIKVEKTGDSEYTFTDIAEKHPILIHAYYLSETIALDHITTEEIKPSNNTYTIKTDNISGLKEKIFLWDSLEGMKPSGTVTVKEGKTDNDNTIVLEHLDTVTAQKIELSGGAEYIYLPVSETAQSEPFTAVAYDNSELPMQNAEIEWTLPEETSDKISIENGVITLDAAYPIENDSGKDIKIRATVKGTEVKAETTLHIRNTARVTDWDIAGAAALKDGVPYEYAIENIKDQYGSDYEGETEFTLTSDKTAAIDGLKITLNTETETEETAALTFTLNGTETKKTKQVTAYAYDFYEPGINEASYGEPRMETVGGVSSIVWPSSAKAKAVTEIPLPVPVSLAAGSEKVITFDNTATNKIVGSQERSLQFVSSQGFNVLDIDFGGSNSDGIVYKDWVKSSFYYGTEIGAYTVGEKASAEFVLKTDSEGVTTAILNYNGKETDEFEVGALGDIAAITLTGSTGAPDDRLLTLTNIKIIDREPSPLEIHGGNTIARVYGATARKQYTAKVFDRDRNERFIWAVTDADGNAVDGVAITQSGMLTVQPEVEVPQTVKITYTSNLDADKKAEKTVTVADYAGVRSFTASGEENIAYGTATSQYAISDIIDEHGDEADMQTGFEIFSGKGLAKIDKVTGLARITPNMTGEFTVRAAVGNPDKTAFKDIKVTVARYAETGDAGGIVMIDASSLANYTPETRYLVTLATSDGELISQTEMTADEGILNIDTTGADKYEVSPIFEYADVGDVSEGFTVPVCSGTYDFTFKKANGTRADIFVNGVMVGQNVDQNGVDRVTTGAEFEAKDIIVTGGKAVVTMKDNDSEMDSITVRKTPEIVNRKPHIFIMGDSLPARYYGEYTRTDENGIPLYGTGQTGWGETLPTFLTPDTVVITNLAEGGSAAASLYATTFPSIMANAQEGDYLIMEAGYQDLTNGGESMMRMSLNSMAAECAEKGVEMILVTPNCAAHGTANTETVRLGNVTLDVAEKQGLLGINLSGMEYPYFTEVGEDYWARNFNLAVPESDIFIDKLHSSYMGAMLHAKYIAQAIYDAQQSGEYGARLDGIPINSGASFTMKDNGGEDISFAIETE